MNYVCDQYDDFFIDCTFQFSKFNHKALYYIDKIQSNSSINTLSLNYLPLVLDRVAFASSEYNIS